MRNSLWTPETPNPMSGVIDEHTRSWFDGLFQGVIAIATLGAGFTFSVIVDPAEPTYDREFGRERVRFCLAISWLLFILALGCAAGGASLFKFHQVITWSVARWVSLLVQLLPLAAFMATARAIAAYAGTVGWVSMGIIGAYALILLGFWVVQSL